MRVIFIVLTTIFIFLGCAETDKAPIKNDKPQGSEGGICFSNGSCNDNLTCVNNICEVATNPCANIECSSWQSCVAGVCKVQFGKCDTNGDCIGEQYCDTNHNCVNPVNPCNGISCSGFGTCVLSNGSPTCFCNSGYHADGLNCVEDDNPCKDVVCDEWESCSEGICVLKSNRCERTADCLAEQTCDSNHNCINPSDPCEGVTCSGFGTCAISGGNATCICSTGYHADGLSCVKDVDPCENVTCSGHGSCVVSGSNPVCVCDSGYYANGLNCIQEVNPCEAVTCSNHGNCAVQNGNPICICDVGYHASALNCIQDANPCDGIGCSGNGVCAVVNSNPVCVCNSGFTGSSCQSCMPNHYGSNCLECPGGALDPCSGNGVCNQGIIGTGVCSCSLGYTGTSCSSCSVGYHLENGSCVQDIVDLCAGVTCSNHGVCYSEDNEFICICDNGYISDSCENCAVGYHLEGSTCVANPEPCDGVTCSGNGICVEQDNQAYCLCEDGYAGDSCESCDVGYYLNNGNCLAYSVDWCRVQWPNPTYTKQTLQSETVYARVLVSVLTGSGTSNSVVRGRVCWSTSSSLTNPECSSDGVINPTCSDCGSNDEYGVALSFSTAGTYYYYYQFSVNNGSNWYSCGKNGVSYNSSQTFQTSDACVANITQGGVAQRGVFISEVADPTVANARFIELYNASTSAVDLNGWSLKLYSNGSTTNTHLNQPLNITIPAGGTWVLVYNISAFNSLFGVTADAQANGVNGNGNDVYALFNSSGELVDSYGVIGVDGAGKDWEYENKIVQRKSSVVSPNATFNISEWNIISGDSSANPKVHSVD